MYCIIGFFTQLLPTLFQLHRDGQFYWWRKPDTI